MAKRERESLQHSLKASAGLYGEIENYNTRKAYKKDLDDFTAYLKNQGIYKVEAISDPVALIQSYCDSLKGVYKPATIHRKISAPCKALEVNMGLVDHPRRTSGAISKGRRGPNDGGRGSRGDKEQAQERFKRIVDFQSATGIRRSELARLRGRDLVRDESGHLCVLVEKGKGGKSQLQRILPEDEKIIRTTFQGVAANDLVFSKKEMTNHINLHGLRADQAKKAYDYYSRRIKNDPEFTRTLIQELGRRFIEAHPEGSKRNALNWLKGALKLDAITVRDAAAASYIVRGDNKKIAINKGLPIEYNRLALLATSALHLSHWRLDVTVTNYLLA